jgi:hypothetical protein
MALLRTARAALLVVAALAIPTAVLAAPSPTRPSTPRSDPKSAARSAAKPKPKKPEPPPGRAPHVSMRVQPSARLWTLTITNDDDEPLVIVADARLLRLEVEVEPELEEVPPVPKKKAIARPKRVVCELPSTMREATRTLTLSPGARYIEDFDPRLYCLGESSDLAGAKLRATLGWSAPAHGPLVAPFVVAPLASATDASGIASAKELAAESFTVDEETRPAPSASSVAASSQATTVASTPSVTVHGGPPVSYASADQVSFEVVVTASPASSVMIYARPQLVGARVRTPRGSVVDCEHPLHPAPIVDFVTTLAPKEKWTAAVMADAICPDHTFDRPGLYEVWPVLHAPVIPHKHAVHGDLRSKTSQWIRVETGPLPFHDQPAMAVPATVTTASARTSE